jgi:hypothetical protein
MKKKELIGNFKDGEADCRPKGDPPRVNAHDQQFKSSLAGSARLRLAHARKTPPLLDSFFSPA